MAVLPFGNVWIEHGVLPFVQVNAGPVVCVSETNVRPLPSVSLSVTLSASFAPKLLTVMVKVTSLFGAANCGPLLFTPTSAELPPATLVPVADVLFSPLLSGVSELTVTLLTSVVPAAAGNTVTTMSNCAVADAASGSIEHVMVPLDPAAGVV